MSYSNFFGQTRLEKVYYLPNIDITPLVASSTELTLFTTDANKGYAIVNNICIKIKSITLNNTAVPRFGTPGSRNAISESLTINTAAVNSIYTNRITYPHTLAPSTNIVLSNNFVINRSEMVFDIFMRLTYFDFNSNS